MAMGGDYNPFEAACSSRDRAWRMFPDAYRWWEQRKDRWRVPYGLVVVPRASADAILQAGDGIEISGTGYSGVRTAVARYWLEHNTDHYFPDGDVLMLAAFQ